MFGKKYFIIGDIGGTNTRLAIIDSNNTFLLKKYYKSKDFGTFSDLLDDVLKSNSLRISKACFAVAGPLNADRNQCHMTNIDWNINSDELKAKYRFEKIILLNDFEALGLSIDKLNKSDKSELEELTSKGFDTKGVIALIGAGTGLGASILYRLKDKHLPLSSELSHHSLPIDASNKLEQELVKYFNKKKIVLEAESVVSGKGMTNIYEFLLSKKIKHNKKVMNEIKKASIEEKPVLITKYACNDKDLLCIKTLNLFIVFYARIARDLAMTSLCSTLIIAGCIAPNIIQVFRESFIEAFAQHEHIEARKLLENTSIYVITDQDATFKGCINAMSLL